MQEMIDAICMELISRKNYLPNATIETIYLGGGTPGILPINFLNKIFDTIYKTYNVSSIAEITLETNPDDMTLQKLQDFKTAGVNRLSVGVQSFFEEDLIYMNRAHDAQQALQCLTDAQEVGFNNLSADLIYGFPLLTKQKFESNLHQIKALNIPHLSCYAMTVEPKTVLAKNIETKKMPAINAEQSALQFEQLMQWTAQNNYEHYEISNFAQPNKRAIHNSNYWKGIEYLGIGPSASSFNGLQRQNNIANNALYIKGINNNLPIAEEEILTHEQKINEYIMIGLRTIEGINLQNLKSICTQKEYENILKIANQKLDLLMINENSIALNNKGKLYADGLACDLFL
jgi:oxygen-independent coproporphyrinogen III oxidase